MAESISGVTGTIKGIIPGEKKGRIMQKSNRNQYETIPKRSYYNAIIRLLEEEYKIIGSRNEKEYNNPVQRISRTISPGAKR